MNGNVSLNDLKDLKKIKDIPKKLVRYKIILIACSIIIPLFLFLIIITGFIASGINNSGGGVASTNCNESGFTLKETSLSKEQFVEKLSSYVEQNGMNSVFSEYAGDIYDRSRSKNINPEVVVIRAIAESGGKSETAPFNYWGINCTNTGGGRDCEKFDSFSAAVDRFLDIASNYETLSDMMAKYSYIGDYWYNPGGAGVGGCYYATYIYSNNVPARVQTACQAICSPDNTTSCIKTTEDDQKAYRDWQVNNNMASIRKSVFGLEANEGVTCTNNGNFPELSNYNLEHDGLKVLDHGLSDSERNDLDNYIDSQINKAGYGTGAGVAAAGQSLIYWFEQKGLYLQYRWGGGHSYYTNTSCGGDSSTFVFSNPYWGVKCGYDLKHSHRVYFGMDCSGFVSWATRTACKTSFNHTSGYWSGVGKIISLTQAKPGDIMDKGGTHVRLIVKNTGDGVIAAEETGEPLSGLVFKKYTSAGGYAIVDMQDWYASNCDRKGK